MSQDIGTSFLMLVVGLILGTMYEKMKNIEESRNKPKAKQSETLAE